MATLQIRDLPEQIYKKIQISAKKEHRSLSQQAVSVLEKGLGISENNKSRRHRILEEIKIINPLKKEYNLIDPVDIIRSDRNR